MIGGRLVGLGRKMGVTVAVRTSVFRRVGVCSCKVVGGDSAGRSGIATGIAVVPRGVCPSRPPVVRPVRFGRSRSVSFVQGPVRFCQSRVISCLLL